MFKIKKVYPILVMILMTILLLPTSACKKDDPTPARETTFDLKVEDVLGITGDVTFVETSATTSTIIVTLNGAPLGLHPAMLCMNSVVEGGQIAVVLNPVDGCCGSSSTLVLSINYDELMAYDGFIKVVKSSTEPNIILAQGDIGGNVITNTSKSYTLGTVGNYVVSGTALFEKRVNGNTLVTVSLLSTIAGEVYPATINLSSIETIGGGPVTKTLNNVNGTTGKSYTNIRKLDAGLVITYDNWLAYNGYINIYQSSVAFENIICQGNIGSSVP